MIKKKTLPFSFRFWKCLCNPWMAKSWALIFIQRLFTLSISFGFHGPPFLTLKTDWLDLRGLDLGKVTSFTHKLKISACKRSLLHTKNTTLKVWELEIPVLHNNSADESLTSFSPRSSSLKISKLVMDIAGDPGAVSRGGTRIGTGVKLSSKLFSPYLKTLRQSRFSSRLDWLPLGLPGW